MLVLNRIKIKKKRIFQRRIAEKVFESKDELILKNK